MSNGNTYNPNTHHITCGLIIGMDMIKNTTFYQLYKLDKSGEIIKTFSNIKDLNLYLIDHNVSIKLIAPMLPDENNMIKLV